MSLLEEPSPFCHFTKNEKIKKSKATPNGGIPPRQDNVSLSDSFEPCEEDNNYL